MNSKRRIGVAIAAVLALSAPSAVGVFKALEPTRGPLAAGLAAIGFELAYLSLSLLTLRPELRRHASAVAIGAVITAITLNTLADYGTRVTGGLASAAAALTLFDPLALILALLESAPLAGLAYALANLLHRLAETPAEATAIASAPAEAPTVVGIIGAETSPFEQQIWEDWVNSPENTFNADPVAGNTSNAAAEPARVYSCKYCQTEGLTKAQQLAHGKNKARTGTCVISTVPAAD
jgi:hypothetical protein